MKKYKLLTSVCAYIYIIVVYVDNFMFKMDIPYNSALYGE